MDRKKILSGLIWALMSTLWFFTLLTASGSWSEYTLTNLLVLVFLSVACFLALWRLLKNRQTLLLATSIAGMAAFLAAYFAMVLPAILP